jgi:hypothetical protein
MITMTEEQFRALLALGLGSLVLLVGMFVYCVRCSRFAYLGEAWIRAAGSYRRAARALTEFTHETEALVVASAYRWPHGTVVRMDRETVENLNALAADRGGGPGL